MPSRSGAFYSLDDLTTHVRRQRGASIKSDRYSLLVTCLCGQPALYAGEVGEAIRAGRCEACGSPLPDFAVLTRTQAADLQHLVHTVAGQKRAHEIGAKRASIVALVQEERDGNEDP